MAATAMARKSVTDLTRRKARAFFTVLTLAIAVASIGIFAVPSLLQQAMDREIASTRLADLTVTMNPLVMSDAQLQAVARVPNVAAVQPKSVFSSRIYIGARRQKAVIIAVPDYARQNTDMITVKSGSAPSTGTVLTDTQNAAKDKFSGGAGTPVRVIAADGKVQTLRVSGQGRYLGGGQIVAEGGFAVFYATPKTLASLSGTAGYTMLAMRLHDTSRPAAERTAAAVEMLRSVKGFTGFADYPEIRTPGDYPGKELFGQVTSIMTMITLLALLSALVLLSNTMTTLIGEQTQEIAAMKAIGASRRQIRRIYRRTALLLGAFGAVLGAGLGIVLANVVVSFFGSRFYGISAGFHVDGTMLAISLAVGLIARARRDAGDPPCIAPFARRSAERDRAAVGGQGAVDRGLRHIRFLPRSAQIGLRGAARRKRRTLATAVQVGLAVGILLGALSLGKAVANMSTDFFDIVHYDVWAQTYASKPFDATAQKTISSIPGVREAQPLLTNNARVAGTRRSSTASPSGPCTRRTWSPGTGTATPRRAPAPAWWSSARRSPTRRTSASATASGSRPRPDPSRSGSSGSTAAPPGRDGHARSARCSRPFAAPERSTTTGSAPPPGTTPRSTGSPRASRTRSPPAATRRPPWSATSKSVTPSRATPASPRRSPSSGC